MGGILRVFPGGRYGVEADYDPTSLPALRALPGARWDRDAKVRWVSSREEDLEDLLLQVQAIGLRVAPEILERAAGRLAKVQEALLGRAGDPRLYPFQQEGVLWLQGRRQALLADEMGLGKTAQALMALPDNARAIIVCPASLKRNWSDETLRWRNDLTPAVLDGKKSYRWPEPGEVCILNYDILPDAVAAGEGTPAGVVLIGDEVQATKSRKARRTKRWSALAKAVGAAGGRVWIMTGTPLLNRPPELWQVLDGAGLAEIAFTHFGRFFKLFNAEKGKYGTEWGHPDPQVPGLLQRVMLRRERRTVLPQLPEKTHRTVVVNNIDKQTSALCDAALDAWDEAGHPDELPAFEAMAHAKEALARAKILALLEMVEIYEESDEPLVVFSDHVAPVEELGKREGWAEIRGGVPSERRAEIVKAFQAGKLRGIALTITAGGTGLTLTRASHMIFCDLNWVPANNVQAEDRICRIGQERGCQYTTLVVSHALDERIREIIEGKMRLFRATVQASKGGGEGAAAKVDALQQAIETFKGKEVEAAQAPAPAKPKGETATCSCGAQVEVRVAGPNAKNSGKKYAKCGCCGTFSWIGEKPASEALREWALKALRYLAIRCDGALKEDGQGFNRHDSRFGKELAARPFLTMNQALAAKRMLIKYQGQLAAGGLWPAPNGD